MTGADRGRRRALPDWLVIARRELLERVRTVWFVVVTLLGPLGMVGMVVVPALLAGSDSDVRIQIVDHTGRVGPRVSDNLTAMGWKVEKVAADTPEATLLARIEADEIDGFLTIPDGALRGPVVVTYQGDNATNQGVALRLDRTVRAAVQAVRGADAGLSPDELSNVLTPVEVYARHTTGDSSGSSGGATYVLGFIVAFIVYMAIVLYAVNVMRSVVQEKTNRIMEIMVAAAKPRALMLGKILGVGGVGLLQLMIWLGISVLTLEYRTEILSALGASGGFSMPSLSAGQIVVILVYFVLGYFFYAALYAAIGAMVNSDQEAQQAQTPVVLFLIVPLTCLNVISGDPRGSTAEILTMIPFFSPVLMPMRYLMGGAGWVQVVISVGILAVSTMLVASLAARIYRVGILMYGKRPSIRELWRWIRST